MQLKSSPNVIKHPSGQQNAWRGTSFHEIIRRQHQKWWIIDAWMFYISRTNGLKNHTCLIPTKWVCRWSCYFGNQLPVIGLGCSWQKLHRCSYGWRTRYGSIFRCLWWANFAQQLILHNTIYVNMWRKTTEKYFSLCVTYIMLFGTMSTKFVAYKRQVFYQISPKIPWQ